MKTFVAKPETVQRDWYVVDATDKTLGRLASEIALRLRGKHKPEMVIEKAVKGMLPKGPLGRAMFRKMKVYAGAEHKHTAQQPQVLDI